MWFSRSAAFTLVELLVVVAIIAILAALSMTVYQMHTTRARVATVIPALNNLIETTMVSFSTSGQVPTNLYNVSGAGGGTAASHDISGLTTYLFYDNGSAWANDSAMMRITVPSAIGEAIPGYIASTDGLDGENNSIAIAFYANETDDTFIVYCGRWDSDSDLYIPPEYLPSGCNSDNFESTVTGN